MIPRLKPYLGKAELMALFQDQRDAVTQFETQFAHLFKADYGIAFPYGRSALWAFFKAMGLEQAEVIMPAYTCVVVAHAIVLSGNIPRFVDITLYDYNMDLDQVEAAINQQTRAIVATHLFGYPLDVERLNHIVQRAEAHYGHKIWVIQDCAHAFGASWQEKLVCNFGDVALFGLNISKAITSIFGGMLTMNNATVAKRVRTWRNAHFHQPGSLKGLRRRPYLAATYLAFNETLYGLVNWLQNETPFLDYVTKAYHLDEKIHFPPDYKDQMTAVEAQVGLVQLLKYPEIVRRRQETAQYYDKNLRGLSDWALPPLVEGATYSHYVVLVQNQAYWLDMLQRLGIQLGKLVDYVVPEMDPYRPYATGSYSKSRQVLTQIINLPIYSHLTEKGRNRVVQAMRKAAESQPMPNRIEVSL